MVVYLFALTVLSICQGIWGACPCSGLKVVVSDQMHCFEILDTVSNSWVDSDATCAKRGGFMAHVDSSDLYSKLSSYVKENYKKPILTGAAVGNPDLKLLALMCPKNTFNSMMEESVVDSLMIGAPDKTRRCVYFQGSDVKLTYDRCDADSQVLCAFPMEKPNYCKSLMNCSLTTTTPFTETSTSFMWSTTPTALNATSAVSTTTVVGSSISAEPSSKTTTGVVIPPVVPPVVPGETSKQPTTTVANSKETNKQPTTTVSNNKETSKHPTTTVAPSMTTKGTTSNGATPTAIAGTTTVAVKPTSPVNKTTSEPTKAPVTPQVPLTSQKPTSESGCGKGYTSFLKWCVPWWAWLLLGLLLIGLLLCCLCWVLHLCCACCLCLIPPRVVEVDRQRPYGIDKQMQTTVVQTEEAGMNAMPTPTPTQSTPPSPPKVLTAMPPPVKPKPAVYEIIEQNEIIFAPVPHAPMNNPGMLVPSADVDVDKISNHSMPLYIEGPKESRNKSHLMQPELVAMATVAAARKKQPRDLPESMPPNAKFNPRPESRPSTRSSILTISPERSPHEMPSTPVNEPSPRGPPRMPPLAPIPLMQHPSAARKQDDPSDEPRQPRQEKRKRRDGPQPFRALPSDHNSPEPTDRKFPSQRPTSPVARPKRKFPTGVPSPTPPPAPSPAPSSLSSNSLFGDQKPFKRSGNDRDPLAPRRNRNFPVLDKQGFQREKRGQLGGVIGGGNGNAPDGWKPWSKTADTFSKNPGFLDA